MEQLSVKASNVVEIIGSHYGNLNLNCVHISAIHKWSTCRGMGGFDDLSCENLLLPQFLSLKKTLRQKKKKKRERETEQQLENRRMERHVHDAAPCTGPRANETSHKFHSSQALMSCCSLSIILTRVHLNRPGNQTMALNQAFAGSHGQQRRVFLDTS